MLDFLPAEDGSGKFYFAARPEQHTNLAMYDFLLKQTFLLKF
jgi:hypothetical protein